jgi:hypothetical protein
MATLDQLSAALVKADAAGNADDARTLAAEIRRMRAQPDAAEQIANDPITKGAQNFASDMGFMDKLNAGAGKAFADLGRGVGQKVGLVSNEDVKESRRLDAPLMKTGAGIAGNIGANVAMLAPASLIPGAASVPAAAAIGGTVGALQPSASTGEAFLNTGMGAAGGAGGQWVANKAAGSVAFQQAEAAKKFSAGAQKLDAARKARDAGYVIPPEDMGGGLVTKILSGAGGKIKTAQVASERNQTVTNSLAKRALGVADDTPLNIDTLNQIRKQAGSAYENIRGAGAVATDAAYDKAIADIATKYKTAVPSFPGLGKTNMHGQAVDEIADLVKAMKSSKQFDASEAVDAISLLRETADKAFRAGDKTLGKANKTAADALEDVVGRHLQSLGNGPMLDAFQQARQTIAKTYTVQKALNNSTGDVSAKALASLLDKQKPLSGELLTAAQANQAFPKATQALKESPKTWSPLDMAFAAAKSDPMGLATLGARPAARSALLSNLAQRKMIENAGQPDQVNALARLLANREAMVPLGMAGGNALANALSR